MKSFEVKALGLEEMRSEELVKTEGGSLLALAAIAVVGLLVTGCISCTVEVNVGSEKTEEKNGGTDVNTDIEVSVA